MPNKETKISERHFSGITYYLLHTYVTKEIAQRMAAKYRYNTGRLHKRFARVMPLEKQWAIWVNPGNIAEETSDI